MPPSPKMNEAKALSLLGIAMRAGQVVSGDDTVERTLRSGKAAMVLLDADTSGNTRDKYQSACQARSVPLWMITADQLGKAIGKPDRLIVAVKKGALAERILLLLSGIKTF